ncbi:hypothetical protein MED01_004237 [Micromonospora sp. MED01]|uniref:hypothetical protein n=1 Tax=Micromonospora alfalfae TaxID=2911212 RepID=UPI001EE7B6DF|nr:hypothetical protein [Micromonospora alfalfae]MCG5460811.1 hypothetical protein [Micromonospora alfalfae]
MTIRAQEQILARFRSVVGVETGPGTSDARPGPRHTARVKRCCKTVLVGERCDCRAVRRQMRAAARQPIFFDFRQAGA